MLNSCFICTKLILAKYAAIVLVTFLIGIHFQKNAFFLAKPIHYHFFGYGMQIVVIRAFVCFVCKVRVSGFFRLGGDVLS